MFGKLSGSTVPGKECSTASQNKSEKLSLAFLSRDFKNLLELNNYKNEKFIYVSSWSW